MLWMRLFQRLESVDGVVCPFQCGFDVSDSNSLWIEGGDGGIAHGHAVMKGREIFSECVLMAGHEPNHVDFSAAECC